MVDSSGDDQPQADSRLNDLKKQEHHGAAEADATQAGHSAGSFVGGAGMLRFAGAGMELGGSAIVCAAIGYALDHYLENTTLIATALGAVFGFAAGLYRFIRMAMAANQSTGRR